MGKKSKRRTNTGAIASAGATSGNNNGTSYRDYVAEAPGQVEIYKTIPRQRFLSPDDWDVNVASIHPFEHKEYQYVSIDAEKYIDKTTDTEVLPRNKAQRIEHYSDCPICFKDAPLTCNQCDTVSYCSKECQKIHWKQSHKKACQKNPNPHKFKLKLEIFGGLTEDCFTPHEFLVLKPTAKLNSLQDICDEVLEPADDLFGMPGFGENQMNNLWLQDNPHHPLYKQMLQRFGWTSGRIGLETVCGYRPAEARFMYGCWCDDAFQMQDDLAPSYYGKTLFPPLESGKEVRGNLVVYKIYVKNKRRVETPKNPLAFLELQLTDDADLEFEYIVFPMNKAELALLLSERAKAMDDGAYTTRMWRYPIRAAEQKIELQAKGGQSLFTQL